MWLGQDSGAMTFRVPDSKEKDSLVVNDVGNKWQNFRNFCWYTNLDLSRRHVDLISVKTITQMATPLRPITSELNPCLNFLFQEMNLCYKQNQ